MGAALIQGTPMLSFTAFSIFAGTLFTSLWWACNHEDQ